MKISAKNRKSWRFIAAIVFLSAIVNLCSCAAMWGKHPERLSTKRDIEKAKPEIDNIDIWNLPLQYYPLLSKFTQLKRVQLYSEDGTLATDDKLKALADLNCTNLFDINLLNCRLVTDEGIRALSRIKSLNQLQLEGTAITDASINILCSMTNMPGLNAGLNVANCSGVTLNGLKILAASENFREIGFSSDNLSQENVLNLLITVKTNVTYCQIVDPQGKLDQKVLKRAASDRGFQLVITPTGALQNMQNQ